MLIKPSGPYCHGTKAQINFKLPVGATGEGSAIEDGAPKRDVNVGW